MPRATSGVPRHKRRNRILKRAKGYIGGRSKLVRTARETWLKGQQYAFAGRRQRKGDFRALWITRITASVKAHGVSYSQFMGALIKAHVGLNRKQLSEMAISDPQGFAKVVELAKQFLPKFAEKKPVEKK